MFKKMKNLGPGPKPPELINCLVEIPKGGSNKYEFDLEREVFVLDRSLYGTMFYPTEYGFIPGTQGEDGDPLDVMVLTTYPTFPGCLIVCRPIGALTVVDSQKLDYKIIAVAENDPRWCRIKKIASLPPHFKKETEDFWEGYARLQPNKKITVGRWWGKNQAFKIIKEAIERGKEK